MSKKPSRAKTRSKSSPRSTRSGGKRPSRAKTRSKSSPRSTRSGGVNIAGRKVEIKRSNIAGRNIIQKIDKGVSGEQLDQLFSPLIAAVRQASPEKQAEAEQKAEALKQEAAKGKQADDTLMAKLIDGIVELVPGAVGALATMFASPILGAVAGPVTNYVVKKLLGLNAGAHSRPMGYNR